MQMTERRAAVIALVESAFKEASSPARSRLVYPGSWETDILIRSLAAVNDQPNDVFIEAHSDSLAEFTPEGLRHVLPYYMRYGLEHRGSEWGITVEDSLLFHLSPLTPGDEYWQGRIAVFSPIQKRAICQYLRHIQEERGGTEVDREIFARAFAIWCPLHNTKM